MKAKKNPTLFGENLGITAENNPSLMKYKKVVVKYINFTDIKEANATKNYPHNGLFVVKVDNGEVVHSELRFIDKSMPTSIFVAPESVLTVLLMKPKIIPKKTN